MLLTGPVPAMFTIFGLLVCVKIIGAGRHILAMEDLVCIQPAAQATARLPLLLRCAVSGFCSNIVLQLLVQHVLSIIFILNKAKGENKK